MVDPRSPEFIEALRQSAEVVREFAKRVTDKKEGYIPNAAKNASTEKDRDRLYFDHAHTVDTLAWHAVESRELADKLEDLAKMLETNASQTQTAKLAQHILRANYAYYSYSDIKMLEAITSGAPFSIPAIEAIHRLVIGNPEGAQIAELKPEHLEVRHERYVMALGALQEADASVRELATGLVELGRELKKFHYDANQNILGETLGISPKKDHTFRLSGELRGSFTVLYDFTDHITNPDRVSVADAVAQVQYPAELPRALGRLLALSERVASNKRHEAVLFRKGVAEAVKTMNDDEKGKERLGRILHDLNEGRYSIRNRVIDMNLYGIEEARAKQKPLQEDIEFLSSVLSKAGYKLGLTIFDRAPLIGFDYASVDRHDRALDDLAQLTSHMLHTLDAVNLNPYVQKPSLLRFSPEEQGREIIDAIVLQAEHGIPKGQKMPLERRHVRMGEIMAEAGHPIPRINRADIELIRACTEDVCVARIRQ